MIDVDQQRIAGWAKNGSHVRRGKASGVTWGIDLPRRIILVLAPVGWPNAAGNGATGHTGGIPDSSGES